MELTRVDLFHFRFLQSIASKTFPEYDKFLLVSDVS
jgi:hypothetical protein